MVYEKIKTLSAAMEKDMVAQRRDFHKYAETGWFETRTTSIIARHLTKLGYEVLLGEQVCDKDARMGVPSEAALAAHYEKALEWGADPEFAPFTKGGMTGVIGILRCGEGPTVGMRFDIDALGVIESDEPDHRPMAEGFASVNRGAMHSCGHDAHATIGMGVATVLMAIREHLHGTIKLIFQPAEEGVRGAKSIVEKGHLDDVNYFLGSHVTGKKPEDPTVIIPGSTGSLATCKYDVTYRGKSAHAGGAPHMGKNALLAAAAAVVNLYAIPRHGAGASRINVGKLVAGSGRNVIADEAFMEIELRGATTEINDYMIQYAEDILRNTAAMYGCSCEMKLMGAATSNESDPDFCEYLRQLWHEKLGFPVSEKLMLKIGGSEDVSYMVNRVRENGGKATFMRAMTITTGPAHNRRFDFDESLMVPTVQAFCAAVADLLK
ncbi:MAG: amidohydrolase [Oscillospiraceae bacterium]|nr:amidohydrolase [Oscillospiraceae bacterium]